MPKSKRNKIVSLTQTKKRPKERKEALVTNVRDAANQYQSIYVFKVANMRNVYLQEVRRRWHDSRFFLGKNKVMTIGLGRDAASEVHQDLHKLSKRVVGVCGLFFTNSPHEEVIEFFNEYQQKDFPRAGWVATETVQLKAGPLPGFSHAIEPHLRELGLPTKLNFGVIELLRDYDVCVQGRAITPEQAKILKLLGHKLATFSFKLTCWYNVPESRYTALVGEDEDEDDADAPEGIEQDDDDE